MSETRNQRRIREILGEQEPEKDHSLRAQAMERAAEDGVPRTMTPWEWEQWYASHGMPDQHRVKPESSRSLWQRLFGRRTAGQAPANCVRNTDEDAEF